MVPVPLSAFMGRPQFNAVSATLEIFSLQQVQAIANIFHYEDSDKIWGVMGPESPLEAEFLAPIFAKQDIVMVSEIYIPLWRIFSFRHSLLHFVMLATKHVAFLVYRSMHI